MNYKNMIDALEINCPFSQFFEEKEQLPMLGASYRRKIAHIQADHTRGKWWNTVWPHHDELATPEIRSEIDAVYDSLTSQNAFPDLSALTAFCTSHPDAMVNKSCFDEFNFYLTRELCCYWLRCIIRDNDYNLYLHAFLQSDSAYRDYYTYLNELRDSGKTNMYGAVPFLLRKYPKLKENCATYILQSWMTHCEQA